MTRAKMQTVIARKQYGKRKIYLYSNEVTTKLKQSINGNMNFVYVEDASVQMVRSNDSWILCDSYVLLYAAERTFVV